MEIFSFFKVRGDLVPLFDDMAREGGMDSADVDWLYRKMRQIAFYMDYNNNDVILPPMIV